MSDEELNFEQKESVLVIILKIETKPSDTNIDALKRLFSDPYFAVQVLSVELPNKIPTLKTLTKSQYIENYFMFKALTYASEGPYFLNSNGELEPKFWWKEIPVIIVKDSSVSNIPSKGSEDIITIKNRISTALEKAKQADLFFLCKWNDYCHQYVDVSTPNDFYGSKLKWSKRPTSTQAIMYTPISRDYIKQELLKSNIPLSDLLNINISQGNLLATVFVPNIIDFDIDLATSMSDFNKLNECATPKEVKKNNIVNIVLWFIIFLIILIAISWFLIQT